VTLRTPLLIAAGLLAATGAAGCDDAAEATPPGCGFVAPDRLVQLVGDDAEARTTGSLAALEKDGAPADCRTTSRKDRKRYVDIAVRLHPEPYQLPKKGCNAGWVYAGTPDAYAPACQETTEQGSRTVLVVRKSEDYIVRITIGRPDRDWAGDPEVALALSDELAKRLR
jgi:hypothetical protein